MILTLYVNLYKRHYLRYLLALSAINIIIIIIIINNMMMDGVICHTRDVPKQIPSSPVLTFLAEYSFVMLICMVRWRN